MEKNQTGWLERKKEKKNRVMFRCLCYYGEH